MKKVAILQSNYIPWKGYFDLIAYVDEFIIYDDMQYTRRDWRNRNQIKTPQGLQWLTVPVHVKGKYHQKIKDTLIYGNEWRFDHWKALEQNYKRAPFFENVSAWVKPIYLNSSHKNLSELNREFISSVCEFLNINTKITSSTDFILAHGKTERLVKLCLELGASEYVSGESAKSYLEHKLFDEKNIKLTWFEYDNYLEYPQQWGPFAHNVSILDLLFNCGKDSNKFMKYV